MSNEGVSNAILGCLFVAGLTLLLIGFGRLMLRARARPDRADALRNVARIQPWRKGPWPQATPEARLIGIGAVLIGLAAAGIVATILIMRRAMYG